MEHVKRTERIQLEYTQNAPRIQIECRENATTMQLKYAYKQKEDYQNTIKKNRMRQDASRPLARAQLECN